MLGEIDVDGLVPDDVGVLEMLDGKKCSLQCHNMFLLDFKYLHCEGFSCFPFDAGVNDSVGTLANFIKNFIFLVKDGGSEPSAFAV